MSSGCSIGYFLCIWIAIFVCPGSATSVTCRKDLVTIVQHLDNPAPELYIESSYDGYGPNSTLNGSCSCIYRLKTGDSYYIRVRAEMNPSFIPPTGSSQCQSHITKMHDGNYHWTRVVGRWCPEYLPTEVSQSVNSNILIAVTGLNDQASSCDVDAYTIYVWVTKRRTDEYGPVVFSASNYVIIALGSALYLVFSVAVCVVVGRSRNWRLCRMVAKTDAAECTVADVYG